MKGYKILSYTKSGGYSTIRHEAKVVAKGFTPDMDEDLAKRLSIDVGYHPYGYGIWGVQVEPTGQDEYRVSWTTAASCD